MTDLRIAGFDRVGLGFSIGDFIPAEVIPEQVIDIEGVTEIPLGLWSLVDHGLDRFLGAFPEKIPAQNAAGVPIDDGHEVDSVFFSPMNVNNSSNSAVWTRSGTGAFGNFSEYSLTQLATVW